MDLSIVTGTYNRLDSLKRMVKSVRRGIDGLYGLEYEIVLVDGGSQDGTITWALKEPDINLIQHGRLEGAVKAFNDGAKAATGHYVILANDDIEFVGNSVWLAYMYMQQNPDCGIGCFYQDRNGRSWHVEEMPCVEDGKQVHRPYGQVCIIPKWMGNYVGWWGDYLKTYGGDNELSSHVYELGYKISPIPEARIHDHEVQDDLRKINNISGGKDPRAVRGHHPDSWAWGKRWRNERLNLVGPIIRKVPVIRQDVPMKERIVYLPIYEPGWEVQKQQKHGLRDALQKVGIVNEYDYMGKNIEIGKDAMMRELQFLVKNHDPTIVLTQFHNADIINAGDLAILQRFCNATWVNWNGDVWPKQQLTVETINLMKRFNLATVVNRDIVEKYRKEGIRAEYWQIGYEEEGIDEQPDQFCDIIFLASGYSKQRQSLGRFLSELQNVNFKLYGSGWPGKLSSGQCLYNFREAYKLYRGARISIGDSQWPETGFVSNRVFQALAAGGAALAHQYFKDMDKLGLIDGDTCIVWHTLDELKEKLYYYLEHESERAKIAIRGEMLALSRHSFNERVKELFNWLGKSIQAENESLSWR